MRIETVLLERRWCERTERRTLVVSFAAHIVALLLIATLQHTRQPADVITEVALLEPGLPAAAPAPAPAPAVAAPATQAGTLRERVNPERFRRVDPGPEEPDPQSETAFEDRIQARLATLQSPERTSLAGLASVTPAVPRAVAPAGAGTAVTGSGIALRRSVPEGPGGGTPLALTREPASRGGGGDLALAALPADRPRRASGAPPKAVPRGSLAGVSLAGPIADRPVLEAARPEYPEWAKQEAIEGAVTLHFVVLPDGTVKEDVMVQKTAGFADFDDNAVVALRSWRFAPLPPGRTGEQWGTVTFQYRIVASH